MSISIDPVCAEGAMLHSLTYGRASTIGVLLGPSKGDREGGTVAKQYVPLFHRHLVQPFGELALRFVDSYLEDHQGLCVVGMTMVMRGDQPEGAAVDLHAQLCKRKGTNVLLVALPYEEIDAVRVFRKESGALVEVAAQEVDVAEIKGLASTLRDRLVESPPEDVIDMDVFLQDATAKWVLVE